MARRSKAQVEKRLKKRLATLKGLVTRLYNRGYFFEGNPIPQQKGRKNSEYLKMLERISFGKLKKAAIPRESYIIIDNAQQTAEKYFSEIKIPAQGKKGAAELKSAVKQLKTGAVRNILQTHTLRYSRESDERRAMAIEKINNAVRIYGEEEVARMFKDYGEENLQDLINTIIYSSGTDEHNISGAFFELDRILSGEARTLEEAQAISEGLESW